MRRNKHKYVIEYFYIQYFEYTYDKIKQKKHKFQIYIQGRFSPQFPFSTFTY